MACTRGHRSGLRSAPRRVDWCSVDVAGRFREYVRLDRQRGEGGLSPAELHRWRVLRQVLASHFSPGTPAVTVEQRESVRVPTCVNVSFATDNALGRCVMTRISRHGVFVQTEHPLELKERFMLRIHVELPLRDIFVPVEVVSLGLGPNYAVDKQGMGLRFLETDPAVTRAIDELYERSVG